MRIKSLTLYQLEIPCKSKFVHAQSTRDSSEVILLKAIWNNGAISWGEMLPREYVTGETIQSIMETDHASVFESLMQQDFETVEQVQHVLSKIHHERRANLSFIGGIELMLLDGLAKVGTLQLDDHLGQIRSTSPGRCVTIGFDCAASGIRGRFIDARMKKATAIKLKVGSDLERDMSCISQLIALNNGGMKIRLDGNGALSYDAVTSLLSQISKGSLHSFEEPLIFNMPELSEKLLAIKARFDIDIMADESLCSLDDAHRIIQSGDYQWFNIRVGKHGGLLASGMIRDEARKAGIGIVGGSMVGETGVLTQASSIFLQRSDDLEYIEGLGQNHDWLQYDPVVNLGGDPAGFNQLDALEHVFELCVRKERAYQG